MIGLVRTARSVLAPPCSERLPWRAHSTDTVTRTHRISALKTSTSATEGSAASPSTILASGRPSMTLLEKTPPSANTDCPTPSSPKNPLAIRRPMPKTIRQLPKKASNRRASTAGSFEKSLISRNSITGKAKEKTNQDSLSDHTLGKREKRISA